MDDLERDEEKELVEEEDDDISDDLLVPGKKKAKKIEGEDLSLDEVAEEEDGILPEDSMDDQDLW